MSSDDNDKSTEQVLEYYKKYSQSRNLPKYFSGTSVSYLPSLSAEFDDVHDVKNTVDPPIDIKNLKVSKISIIIDNPEDVNKNSPNASSSGSPSDHKKLEWDNGADIGYNSARRNSEKKLQKSSSLPILDSVQDLKFNLNVPSTIITHSTSTENVGILVFSSSSTSNQESPKNSGRQCTVSSSSVITDNQREKSLSTDTSLTTSDQAKSKGSTHTSSDESRFLDFQRTIEFLKGKIGLPGAHSTPNVANNPVDNNYKAGRSKPSLAAFLSQDLSEKGMPGSSSMDANTVSGSFVTELGKKSKSSRSKHSSISKLQSKKAQNKVETKIVELSISNPINVNCKGFAQAGGSGEPTSQTKNPVALKAVQTENIALRHMESQCSFQSNRNEPHRPKTILVSEDMADSASSFEYIRVSKHENPAESTISVDTKRKKTLVKQMSGVSGVLKEISLSKNTTESSSISRSSSEDIDRYLERLQKLFKTKKINSSTKRRYIKSLLKELNELDMTNSSNTSSDLFIPKKDREIEIPKSKAKSKVAFKETDVIISSFKSHGGKEKWSENEESDCPKCAEDFAAAAVSKIPKRLDRNNAIEQGPSSCDGMEDSNKGSSKTSTSERKPTLAICSCSSDQVPSLRTEQPKLKDDGPLSLDSLSSKAFSNKEHISQYSSSDKPDYKSTRSSSLQEGIQKSKPLVQEHSKGTDISDKSKDSTSRSAVTLSKQYSDDYLLKFAENERTYQLNWINNEINHLSKLKSYLELNSRKSSQAKTTVYKVVQRDASSRSSERNYVIQTKVDVAPEQTVNYVVDGKEYVVSDSQKSSSDTDRAIIADLEIHSNENQTNIKVRTLCSICMQAVCVCLSAKTIHTAFPSLSTEWEGPEACLSCLQVVCICTEGGSSSKRSSPTEPIKEIPPQSDQEIMSQEDSMQRVFKKCCCTIDNANCGCDFVKKLLNKFRVQRDKIDIATEEVQTDTMSRPRPSSAENRKKAPVCEDSACQTNKLSGAWRSLQPTESVDLQVDDLQSLRDVLCKSTQTWVCSNESTQTRQKKSAKIQCTCGNIATSKDCKCQTTKNLSKDDAVQACNTCDKAVEANEGKYSFRAMEYVAREEGMMTEIKEGILPEKSTMTEGKGPPEPCKCRHIRVQTASDKGRSQSSAQHKHTEAGEGKYSFRALGNVARERGMMTEIKQGILPEKSTMTEGKSSPEPCKCRAIGIQAASDKGQSQPSAQEAGDKHAEASEGKYSFRALGNVARERGMMTEIKDGILPEKSTMTEGKVSPEPCKCRDIGIQAASEKGRFQALGRTTAQETDDKDAVVRERGMMTEILPEKSTMTGDNGSQVRRNIGIQAYPAPDKVASPLSGRQKVSEKLEPENAGPGQENADKETQYTQRMERDGNAGTTASNSQNGSRSLSASTSKSDSRTTDSSRIICFCCKQKAFLAEVSYLQDGNDSLAVCSRCYYNKPRYCRHNPNYGCRCWTYWYPRQQLGTEQICRCCRMDISKCPRRSMGLAYTVTLQNDGSARRRRISSRNDPDNIKVQDGWSWKSVKNKENYFKKDNSRKNKVGRERRKKEANDEDKDEMEKDKYKKKSKKGGRSRDTDDDIQYTLMEYLIKNRPEFVCSAEYRRQMLLNSRILREQQKDDLKLNFLENNLKNSDEANYKLFTAREMKDINKKNYKKLPEVQEKLVNQRQNRLRHADRLISDVFAKKVQKSVLQGRGNFPIDKPLANL